MMMETYQCHSGIKKGNDMSAKKSISCETLEEMQEILKPLKPITSKMANDVKKPYKPP